MGSPLHTPAGPAAPALYHIIRWPSGMGLARGPSGWPSAEGDQVEPAEDPTEPGQRAAKFSMGLEEGCW